MPIESEYNKFSIKGRKDIIINCLKTLITVNSSKRQAEILSRYTDFHGLANELKQSKYLGKGYSKNNGNKLKYDHTSLILLSDFLHEEDDSKKDIQDVTKAWSGMGNLVSQINLISFDGSSNSVKSRYISNDIREVFKRSFNHLYFFEFDKNFNNVLTWDQEINTMFSTVIDGEKPKPLVVYHSWDKQDYKHDYKGEVQILKNISEDLIISFSDRIRPTDYIKPFNYLVFETKKENSTKRKPTDRNKIKLYEYHKNKLVGDDEEKYKVTF